MTIKKYSIVVSLYNENEAVEHFWLSLRQSLLAISAHFEVIWVNDGSQDNTQQLIENIRTDFIDRNITHIIIEFSRNFGHEAAMIAGIDHASGNAIICIDSDGQHPTNEIKNLLKEFENGSEIVLTERMSRQDNSFIKNMFSRFFYKIINHLSEITFQKNSTDFFLISNKISEILKTDYRDKNRFIRGFIQSLGFSISIIKFYAPSREFGKSKYSFKSLIKLGVEAIFSFSNKPLRISMLFSIIFIIITILFSTYSLYQFIFGSTPPSGYTTIVIFLSSAFSLLFLTITILSLYFEKLIIEIRNHPIYLIKKILK